MDRMSRTGETKEQYELELEKAIAELDQAMLLTNEWLNRAKPRWARNQQAPAGVDRRYTTCQSCGVLQIAHRAGPCRRGRVPRGPMVLV